MDSIERYGAKWRQTAVLEPEQRYTRRTELLLRPILVISVLSLLLSAASMKAPSLKWLAIACLLTLLVPLAFAFANTAKLVAVHFRELRVAIQAWPDRGDN